MNELLLLLLLFSPFVFALVILPTPIKWRKQLGIISSLFALTETGIVTYFSYLYLHNQSIYFTTSWIPETYINFSLLTDGLSLFFSLLITGMGALVSFYAYTFMNKDDTQLNKFYCYINIFMGSMLGAVLADNFVILFLFWELTGITSYLLISYHWNNREARRAARSAFLITSFASLCLLLGFVLIGVLDQTLEISEVAKKGLIDDKHPFWIFLIILLILIGVYAKSAQFPLHFWLPGAMTAPTPVSAYLHSATMVKLGIYVLARIYVIFIGSELWFPLVTSLSLITILVGGVSALFAESLKKILAYATISQLGFFISFYGIGDAQGLEYDFVHIFNHALYKGSLFMLVGILSVSAGIHTISGLSGLIKKLPLWSFIFILSLAAMAGIPGTTGFLSKELLLRDTVMLIEEEPTGAVIFTVLFLGLLIKVAFSYRLLHYMLFHKNEESYTINSRPTLAILFSPFILSMLALAFGVWPQGLEALSDTFFTKGLHKSSDYSLSLWHGMSVNLLLSLLLFSGGILLFFISRSIEKYYLFFDRWDFSSLWSRFFDQFPHYANLLTELIHSKRPENNTAWAIAIFSIGILTLMPMIPFSASFAFSQLTLVQGSIIASCIALLFISRGFSRLVMISLIGFLITLYFVLKNAPDLAMTQMVVEVATLFLFILLFSKMERSVSSTFSWKRVTLSTLFGGSIALIPFLKGSLPSTNALAQFYTLNALPLAKGSNIVNTIIVDFRALDTLGEICVIIAAVLGVYELLKRVPNLIEIDPIIPSPILRAVMPAIFTIAAIFSSYLLVRGHNYPGGGFIGAVVMAVTFILVEMAVKKSRIFFLDRFNAMHTMFLGLFLALAASTFSLIGNGTFFEAEFFDNAPLLNTPFVFDLGILLLVTGAVARMVHLMRLNTLGGLSQ